MILYDRVSWLSMVFRVHGSVMPRIIRRVVATALLSVVFTYLQRNHTVHLSLTVTPFLITALPLGIILGFRNTSSYDRFWEGRKLWGVLVNASRSLLRQMETFVIPGAPQDAGLVLAHRREMAYRLVAFVHALRVHLRRESDRSGLAPFLGEAELAALDDEACPPAAILHRLGADVRIAGERGWLHSLHAVVLEGTLGQLTDVVGGCERIKNTPTPISYLIFIHRAVAFYCFLLPFGLADTVKELTPVVVFFVSYALFSLDAIGDELDDPFRGTENTLPISSIARAVEIYVRRRLGEKELPRPLEPQNGVLR